MKGRLCSHLSQSYIVMYITTTAKDLMPCPFFLDKQLLEKVYKDLKLLIFIATKLMKEGKKIF